MAVDHQHPHHIQAAARDKLASAAGAAAQRAEALFKADGPIEPAIHALEAATRAFTAALQTPAVVAPSPASAARRVPLRMVRIPPGGAVTSDTAELKQWQAVLGAVRAAVAASVHAGHPKYRDPSNPDDAGTGDGPADTTDTPTPETPTPETPTPETPTPETPTTSPGTPPPTDTPPPTTPDTPPPTDTPPPDGTLPDAGSAAIVVVLGTPLEDAALGVAAQIAAALGVALAPAAAVGILIVIALTLSSDAAPELDCKKVKEDCIEECGRTLPTRDYGAAFRKCKRLCMEAKGCF